MTNDNWKELSAAELTQAIHAAYATDDEDEYGFPIDDEMRARWANQTTNEETALLPGELTAEQYAVYERNLTASEEWDS